MSKATVSEVAILAFISHGLTVAARGTYEPNTENVIRPLALRAYNEVQHRVTAAIQDQLETGSSMPVKDILVMLDIMGNKYGEADNIRFILDQAAQYFGEDWHSRL